MMILGSQCPYFGGDWFTVLGYIGNDKMLAVPWVEGFGLKSDNSNNPACAFCGYWPSPKCPWENCEHKSKFPEETRLQRWWHAFKENWSPIRII